MAAEWRVSPSGELQRTELSTTELQQVACYVEKQVRAKFLEGRFTSTTTTSTTNTARKLDPQPTDVVGIACSSRGSPHSIACILGVLQAGCAYVILAENNTMEYCRRLFEETACCGLIVVSSGSLLSKALESVMGVAGTDRTVVIQPGVVYESNTGASSEPSGGGCPGYVMATSGTTREDGVGVTITVPLACAERDTAAIAARVDITSNDVLLQASPLSFDPSVIDILLMRDFGARLVCIDWACLLRPDLLQNIIIDEGITAMCVTPLVLAQLTGSGERVAEMAKSLRAVIVGGEAFPPYESVCCWLEAGVALYNIYGTTEASVWATLDRVDGENSEYRSSGLARIGTPLGEKYLCIESLENKLWLCVRGSDAGSDERSGGTSDDDGSPSVMYTIRGEAGSEARQQLEDWASTSPEHAGEDDKLTFTDCRVFICDDHGLPGEEATDGCGIGGKGICFSDSGARQDEVTPTTIGGVVATGDLATVVVYKRAASSTSLKAAEPRAGVRATPAHSTATTVTTTTVTPPTRTRTMTTTLTAVSSNETGETATETTVVHSMPTPASAGLTDTAYTAESSVTATATATATASCTSAGAAAPTLKLNADVYITGRADSQVKLRGQRVNLDCVAQGVVAASRGAIRGGVAAADTDGNAASTLNFAYAADVPLGEDEVEAIRSAAASRLPSFAVPNGTWTCVGTSLPLNANGKVDKAAVARLTREAATNLSHSGADGDVRMSDGNSGSSRDPSASAILNAIIAAAERFRPHLVGSLSDDSYLVPQGLVSLDLERIVSVLATHCPVREREQQQEFRTLAFNALAGSRIRDAAGCISNWVSGRQDGEIERGSGPSSGKRSAVSAGLEAEQSSPKRPRHEVKMEGSSETVDGVAKKNTVSVVRRVVDVLHRTGRGHDVRRSGELRLSLPVETLPAAPAAQRHGADAQWELNDIGGVNLRKCIDASPLVLVYDSCEGSGGDGSFAACGLAIVGSHSGDVVAFELGPHSPQPVWRTTLPDRVESSATCSDDYKFVFVGCYDGNFYCLESETGQQSWSVDCGSEPIKCSPLFSNGTVYVGTHGHEVLSINANHGGVNWRYAMDKPVFATPVVVEGGGVVVFCDTSGLVVGMKLQSEEPSVKWKLRLDAPVFSSPIWCERMHKLYVVSVNGRMFCVDVFSSTLCAGEEFSQLDSVGDVIEWVNEDFTGPVYSSPTLVVSDTDRKSGVAHAEPAVVVCVGCHDGVLRGVCGSSGHTVWQTEPLGAPIYASPFPLRLSVLGGGEGPFESGASSNVAAPCVDGLSEAVVAATTDGRLHVFPLPLYPSNATPSTGHSRQAPVLEPVVTCESDGGEVFSSPVAVAFGECGGHDGGGELERDPRSSCFFVCVGSRSNYARVLRMKTMQGDSILSVTLSEVPFMAAYTFATSPTTVLGTFYAATYSGSTSITEALSASKTPIIKSDESPMDVGTWELLQRTRRVAGTTHLFSGSTFRVLASFVEAMSTRSLFISLVQSGIVDGDMTQLYLLYAGCAAVGATLSSPFSLAATRGVLQNPETSNPSGVRYGEGITGGLYRLYALHGVGALWESWRAIGLARWVDHMFYVSEEVFSDVFGVDLTFPQQCALVVAHALATQPLETVATRMSVYAVKGERDKKPATIRGVVPPPPRGYHSLTDCVMRMYEEEGLQAFYRGLLLNKVILADLPWVVLAHVLPESVFDDLGF